MVKWTDHALTQLRHIHDYIAQDSPLYAKRVSESLVSKTIGLDELPRIGRVVPEGLSNQLCNFLISERGQRHALFPEHHLEALQCRLPVVNLLPVA